MNAHTRRRIAQSLRAQQDELQRKMRDATRASEYERLVADFLALRAQIRTLGDLPEESLPEESLPEENLPEENLPEEREVR